MLFAEMLHYLFLSDSQAKLISTILLPLISLVNSYFLTLVKTKG